MTVLITICARGGSKGIPGKNIKPINSKPLIQYSIELAKQFQNIYSETSIILSTDSDEIKKTANDAGLTSEYSRPTYLGNDTTGKIATILDVLLWKEKTSNCRFDYILDLDVTSPLRNLNDLIEAFKLIKENDKAINLFSVSHASRSPYFNMVELKKNGFYSQVKIPRDIIFTRQSSPKVYDMNASFYYYKRAFFELGYKSAITNKSIIYIVPHLCFDLDHMIDFEILSYLIQNNKLDFTL